MRAKDSKGLWGWMSRPGTKVSEKSRPKKVRGVKTLWGKEFTLAKDGLEEAQVIAFVEELISRYNSVVKKLQHPPALSELAGKVILEAEKLRESIKEDERKHAAEQAAKIIYGAEERSKQVAEESERAAALRLEEATRLSVEIIGKAREKTTLAEAGTRQHLPQHVANIQSALQAAIDQAYQRVIADLVDLEREIQSKGTGEEPQLIEPLGADAALVEPQLEAREEEPQLIEPLGADAALVEPQLEAREEEPQLIEPLGADAASVERQPEVREEEPQLIEPLGADAASVERQPEVREEEPQLIEPLGADAASVEPQPEVREEEPQLIEPLGADAASVEYRIPAKEEEVYDSLSRDEVREKILESLEQVTGLNGHGEDLTANREATIEEEQMPPDPNPDNVATNGNGNGSKTNLDLYQGDLEFIMPPQRGGHEAMNHLARLSALYMAVKKIPGASVLGTGGSEAEGNSIAMHFENPVCLAEVLKDFTMWEEEEQGNGANRSRSMMERLRSGKGSEESQRKRIVVTL